MTPADRAKLRALADAATPGPWKYDCVDEIDQLTDAGKGYPLDLYPDSAEIVRGHSAIADLHGIVRDTDGEFIAASRSAIPALLDALDERDQRGGPDHLGDDMSIHGDFIRVVTEVRRLRDLLIRAEDNIERCDGTCGDDVSFLDNMKAALWPAEVRADLDRIDAALKETP